MELPGGPNEKADAKQRRRKKEKKKQKQSQINWGSVYYLGMEELLGYKFLGKLL